LNKKKDWLSLTGHDGKEMRACLCVSILTVIFLLSGIDSAHAIPFTSIVDWNDHTDNTGVGYKVITDPIGDNSNYAFTYTHSLNLVPAGEKLNNAELQITHKNNLNINLFGLEVWFADADSNTLIGRLGNSQLLIWGYWRTDSFTLSPAILQEIQSNSPWALTVKLREGTSGSESIWLDKSVLSGDYTPAPEPASIMLVGLGLAGFLARRKQKLFRQ